MNVPKHLIEQVLALPTNSRNELVELLLASLDKPDAEIDKTWKEEVEQRIDAYEKGEMRALGIEEVIAKYK